MKGQFFSYDAIVAASIFAILFTLLLVYWTSLRSVVFTQIDDMFRVAIMISDSLLTPGNPANWVASPKPVDVQQYGLTGKYGSVKLDINKVIALNQTISNHYDSLKFKWGVGAYEIFISVAEFKMGKSPADYSARIAYTRQVIYDDEAKNLSIILWSP